MYTQSNVDTVHCKPTMAHLWLVPGNLHVMDDQPQQLLDVFAKLPIELGTMPGFDCHLFACWERVDASGFFDSHHFVFHMFLLLDYRRSINAI